MATDFDDVLVPGMIINEPRFCLMNQVCNKHVHLQSITFKENHADLSNNVLRIIERAKSDNMKQVDDQISAVTNSKVKGRAKMLRDLNRAREYVVQFNADLDEEWQELVSFPEAFDSHIHEQIKQEQ